ncbi:MAG TPA: methyltransferase domain-containing protein [Coriobacteriia bacterium]|nr:methyltransferase domain-containing protein [Coriobacteriia bacterium]
MKFNLAKLERLNDPGRFDDLKPDVMWSALGAPSPSVIVEIGAGTGLFAERFAALAPAAVVYAADIEQTMVDWMRENRADVASGRLVPLLAEETRVPLDDGIADLVVMINLHHELVDADASYREASRLLKRGGQLLVADWAPVDSPKGPPKEIRIDTHAAVAFLESAGLVDVAAHEGLTYAWLVTAVKP